MTFTMQKLVGSRVLVGGSDILGNTGQVILDSTQWDEVNADSAFNQAQSAFDEAVAAFYAPITAAQEALESVKSGSAPDPATYVVLEEATEGVPANPGKLIKLTHDSIVLRLLSQGAHNRLVWVGDDSLEVLEASAAVQVPVGGSGGHDVPADASL